MRDLLREAREAVLAGRFGAWRDAIKAVWRPGTREPDLNGESA
jgi:hypothetical protein